MANGTCCIGSRVGGIPELLDDELLFQKADVNEICDLLVKLSDDAFRTEKAKKCYSNSQLYNLDLLNKKRLEFMKNVFFK